MKCSQYWPEKEQDLEINPYVIKTTNEKAYAFYIIRSIGPYDKEEDRHSNVAWSDEHSSYQKQKKG